MKQTEITTSIFNNKEHIKVYHLQDRSEEWLEFRKNMGIGGSEISSIMGINKYESSIELFHKKIGTKKLRKELNQNMFWGIQNENKVRDLWKYVDGTEEGYINNYQQGIKLRTIQEINGIIVNEKYPFIYANIDGIIPSGQFMLDTGEISESPGILEIKTTNSYASKQFEDGINPSYLIQIHQYMIVTETDYAELCILTDGNKLEIHPVRLNKDLCETIIAMAKEFWFNKILPARETYEKELECYRNGDFEKANEYNAIINNLEPIPDASESYKNFLKDDIDITENEMMGNIEHYVIAQKRNTYHEIEKWSKDQKLLCENIIRKYLRDNEVDKATYGDKEYIGLNKNKAFANKVKGTHIPSREIKTILKQLL